MKTISTFFILAVTIGATSCSKDIPPVPTPVTQSISVPNGDFESWSNDLPLNWETNSCPVCVPPYETYIVQKDVNAYQGLFAAKFIYNNVHAAFAVNGFAVSTHPDTLSAYVKCNLVSGDSVQINVTLFDNNLPVDNGQWYGTTTIPGYTQIHVPITQNSSQADSVAIYIEGGHVNAYPLNNTEFWVDDISLE